LQTTHSIENMIPFPDTGDPTDWLLHIHMYFYLRLFRFVSCWLPCFLFLFEEIITVFVYFFLCPGFVHVWCLVSISGFVLEPILYKIKRQFWRTVKR
jgi:hypothetical protein